jgi:hypothetical protein
LEGRVEELNQNCACFCCNQLRKVSNDNHYISCTLETMCLCCSNIWT